MQNKIPQELVYNFINLGTAPAAVNEVIDCDVSGIANGNFKGIKRFILEMKIQIDRWGLVMSVILVHPDMMKFISFSLGNEISNSDKGYSIWGTRFLVNGNVPINTMIGLASLEDLPVLMEEYSDARYLAIGKLDFEALERMNKLKAFW